MAEKPMRMTGGVPTWEDWNRLLDYVESRTNIHTDGSIEMARSYAGVALSVPHRAASSYFWAQITGHTLGISYDFAEVYKSGTGYGDWAVKEGGITGTARNLSEVAPGTATLGTEALELGAPSQIDVFPVQTGRIVLMQAITGTEGVEYWFEGDLYMQSHDLSRWQTRIIFARITGHLGQTETYDTDKTVTRYIYQWEQVYKKNGGYERGELSGGQFVPLDPHDPWANGGDGDATGGKIDTVPTPPTIGPLAGYNFAEQGRDFSGEPVPNGTIVQMAKVDYTHDGTVVGQDEYWFNWESGGAAAGAFWAKVESVTPSDGRNLYAFTQVEKSTAGYGGWAPMAGGVSGAAYNAAEDATGAYGALPVDSIVLVQTVRQGTAIEYWISDVLGNGVNADAALKILPFTYGAQNVDFWNYGIDGGAGNNQGVQVQGVSDVFIANKKLYARTRAMETDENGHVIGISSESGESEIGAVGGITPNAGANIVWLGSQMGTQDTDYWQTGGSDGTAAWVFTDLYIDTATSTLRGRARAITLDENGFPLGISAECTDPIEIGAVGGSATPNTAATLKELGSTQGTQDVDTWMESTDGAGGTDPKGVLVAVNTDARIADSNLYIRQRTIKTDENGFVIGVDGEGDEALIGKVGGAPNSAATLKTLSSAQGTQDTDTWDYGTDSKNQATPKGAEFYFITDIQQSNTDNNLKFRRRKAKVDENGMLFLVDGEGDTIDVPTDIALAVVTNVSWDGTNLKQTKRTLHGTARAENAITTIINTPTDCS